MKIEDLKKKYEVLRKKYNLPRYKDLDDEFELFYIGKIQEINNVLGFIRRRICDKIGWYLGYLQSILNPNPSSLINIQESKFLEEDKEKIIKLLRELVQITSFSVLRELEKKENLEAEFIRFSFEKWLKIKEELIFLIKKVVEKWKKEEKKDTKKEKYFGWKLFF